MLPSEQEYHHRLFKFHRLFKKIKTRYLFEFKNANYTRLSIDFIRSKNLFPRRRIRRSLNENSENSFLKKKYFPPCKFIIFSMK